MTPRASHLITGWAVTPQRLAPLREHLTRLLKVEPVMLDFHPVEPFRSPAAQTATEKPSAYAEALHDLIIAEDGAPLLIGWSTGALIALEIAFYWPDDVAQLVLLGGTPCFCRRSGFPHGTREWQVRYLIKQLRKRNPERILEEFFQRSATPERLSPEDVGALVDGALDIGPEALCNGLDHLIQTDLRHFLPAIPHPTLAIHGSRDAVIPVDAARWMCDRLPDATLICEPDAGHVMPLLDPEAIAVHIRDFIAQQP